MAAVQNPPQDIGDVIGHDAEQEILVDPHRWLLLAAALKDNIMVLYHQDHSGQKPDGRIVHIMHTSS